MRFSVLGSGSGGNATVVCAGDTTILVDAGFSGRELTRRLGCVGMEPSELAAIVVTHEHGDHTRGTGVMARKYGVPLFMTGPTRRACSSRLRGSEVVVEYRAGYAVEVGDLVIEPVITIHDAANPVALAILDRTTGLRLGIATDMGRPTVQLRHALRGCNGLIVESNHDRGMLSASAYPASVKSRIASSHGHLSNQAATRLVLDLFGPHLTTVVLAHLSEESNTPELARSVMKKGLAKVGFRGVLEVAGPHEPIPIVDLQELRQKVGPNQLPLFR